VPHRIAHLRPRRDRVTQPKATGILSLGRGSLAHEREERNREDREERRDEDEADRRRPPVGIGRQPVEECRDDAAQVTEPHADA
jgi:hypothetical protein